MAAAFQNGAAGMPAGRASSVFEVLGGSPSAVPKCEVINEDVFAIRIDEDRLRTGPATTVVRCEFHLPEATPITSLWAALLPYNTDTKRKVLSDREDSVYYFDTYHDPWRQIKVPVGNQTVLVEEFTATAHPYIIAASLRGPSFPPHLAEKKKTGLVAFSQVVGRNVKAECFVRRTAPTPVGAKRKLRGQPDAQWDKHDLKAGALRVTIALSSSSGVAEAPLGGPFGGTDPVVVPGADEAEAPASQRSRQDDKPNDGVSRARQEQPQQPPYPPPQHLQHSSPQQQQQQQQQQQGAADVGNGSNGLADLLRRLGLSQLGPVFANEEIDLEALRLLKLPDYEALGIKMGPRVKLMNALAQ